MSTRMAPEFREFLALADSHVQGILAKKDSPKSLLIIRSFLILGNGVSVLI